MINPNFKHVLMLLPVFLCQFLFAQSIQIKGEVKDKITGEPIVNAHVGLKEAFIGTITNLEGEFVLKIPTELKDDSLQISHVGYRVYSTSVSLVEDEPLSVELEMNALVLNEINIKPLKPKEIIVAAVKKIPANYSQQEVNMKAFYRETIREGSEMISLAEGVLDIYKPPYGPPVQDQMSLVKGRKAEDREKIKLLQDMTISGGLQVDFVKNGITFLFEQYFKYFNYELDDIILEGDDQFYVINFTPRKRKKDRAQLKGQIYIDTESMAFRGVEYELIPDAIKRVDKKTAQERANMKRAGVSVETLSSKTYVDYRKKGNVWHLHSAHAIYTVNVEREKENLRGKVTYQSDLVITSVDSKNIKTFPKNDQLATYGKGLGEQMMGQYLEDAWDDDNYIKVEDAVQQEIEDFLRKNSNGN